MEAVLAQRVFVAWIVWIVTILAPAIANGQSPERQASIDLKGSIGHTGFFDDDGNHLHTSVAARLYVTDRLSLEPEVQYLRPHDDLVIAANVNLDLRRGRVIPYISVGIGVMNTRDVFAQGGVGTKITIGESWFLAPDVRFGYYFHIRSSIGFGYAFGRATGEGSGEPRSAHPRSHARTTATRNPM